MVKVRGCHWGGFEASVFLTCNPKNQGRKIWVESATFYKQIGMFPKNNRLFPERDKNLKLLFEYDEGSDKRVWEELKASMASEVVLVGQFETSRDIGFGHLGAYDHELILVNVLESKSGKAQ